MHPLLLTVFFLWSGVSYATQAQLTLEPERSYEQLPLARHLTYVHDPDGTIRLEDIVQGTHKAEVKTFDTDHPSLGFHPGAFWMRLTLVHIGSSSRVVVIEHDGALSDYIDFYHRDPSGQWTEERMGDRTDFRQRTLPYRQPAVRYVLSPGTHEFLFRLETAGTASPSFALWDDALFYNHVRSSYALIGMLFGFFVVMFFYSIFLYFSFRSSSYIYYTIYLLTFGFSQLGYHGLASEWLSGDLGILGQNELFLLSLQIAMFAAIFFAMSFLRMRTLMPRIYQVSRLCCFLLSILFVLQFSVGYGIQAFGTNLVVLLSSVALLYTGIYAIALGYRPAIFYTIAWSILLISSVATALRIIGVFPDNFLSNNPLLFASIEMVLMSLALADRMNFIKDQAEREIRHLNNTLQDHLTRVEELVAERTRTISTIIDHVQSGFFMIDRNLNVCRGFTRSCIKIFDGLLCEERPLTELLPIDNSQKQIFRLAIEQVYRDTMPEEVALSQVPASLIVNQKALKLDWTAVRDEGGAIRLLLATVQDVSALRDKEREAQRHQMLFKIVANMDAFRSFLQHAQAEAKRLAAYAGQDWKIEVYRYLHTLKGNCLVFSLQELAETIHEIEEQEPHLETLVQVRTLLEQFLERHHRELRISWAEISTSIYKLNQKDFDSLRTQTSSLLIPQQIHQAIEGWIGVVQAKTLRDLLGPIEEDVAHLANRLQKQVRFVLKGEHHRIVAQPIQDFTMSLIHLIRNAVIHGLEDDRVQAGKAPEGHVQLELQQNSEGLWLILSDDGCGLDRRRLEDRLCKEQNLDRAEVEDLSLDQLVRTTQSPSRTGDINLYAGRGVGLAAVIELAERIQGRVRIESVRGQGTRFIFHFPEETPLLRAS